MPVPNFYQTAGEPKFISLSLQDSSTGKGYITYYAAGYYNGASGTNVASYTLLPSAFPAGKINTATSGGSQTNFDVTILKSIVFEGDVFVTYTISSPTSVSCQNSVILQKISGGQTVKLAEGSGSIVSGNTARRIVLKLNMPRTPFKRNDRFRVRVELGNAAGESSTLWHDPSTRKQTTQLEAETQLAENTDFIINVPVVLID